MKVDKTLLKKAYKKNESKPELLNVNDEEWLIEDGVLKEYRGHSKNLFVPEGVIIINPNALRNKGLNTVYLPNTLKYMLEYCLAYNNLEEIDLPSNLKFIYTDILKDNKITKLKLNKGIIKLN